MKKILYTLLLAVALISVHHTGSAQGQQIPTSLVTLSTLADLRAFAANQPAVVQLLGLATANDGNNGFYSWSTTSTATDDGYTVVASTGITTGRWLRMLTGNTVKGSVTLSGTALQTAYPITYPSTLPISPAIIIIQAYSANAAVPSWVSAVTTTGFTANFSSVPVLGTNNISINYIIFKQ